MKAIYVTKKGERLLRLLFSKPNETPFYINDCIVVSDLIDVTDYAYGKEEEFFLNGHHKFLKELQKKEENK